MRGRGHAAAALLLVTEMMSRVAGVDDEINEMALDDGSDEICPIADFSEWR